MWRTGTSAEAAFTLLEVLIVVMILSLVGTAAALILPNASDRARLNRAETWLDSALAEARGRARREGRAYAIEFDLSGRRYRRTGAAWQALPSGVAWAVEGGRRTTDGTTLLTFLSDGTGSGAVFSMRAGSVGATRRIDRLTGTIRYADQ